MYRKIGYGLLGMVLMVMVSSSASAQETATVTLQLPVAFEQLVCPTPIWTGKEVVWGGVTDTREEISIGAQQRKSNRTEVLADRPLADYMSESLQSLFKSCGMKIATGSEESHLQVVSVDIMSFYAGVEKKMFTGKGNAYSQLTFTITDPTNNATSIVNSQFNLQIKKGASRDIRQLTQTLNELMSETLKAAVTLPDLKKVIH